MHSTGLQSCLVPVCAASRMHKAKHARRKIFKRMWQVALDSARTCEPKRPGGGPVRLVGFNVACCFEPPGLTPSILRSRRCLCFSTKTPQLTPQSGRLRLLRAAMITKRQRQKRHCCARFRPLSSGPRWTRTLALCMLLLVFICAIRSCHLAAAAKATATDGMGQASASYRATRIRGSQLRRRIAPGGCSQSRGAGVGSLASLWRVVDIGGC
jgi:hypothetical protein